MKTIEVVAAILRKDDKYLSVQRGYGEFAGGWEFPGGKVEPGEEEEAALIREIQEEMNLDIKLIDKLCSVEYDYPSFHLLMHCYIADPLGSFSLNEHSGHRWLGLDELDSVDWLPADIEVVEALKDFRNKIDSI